MAGMAHQSSLACGSVAQAMPTLASPAPELAFIMAASRDQGLPVLERKGAGFLHRATTREQPQHLPRNAVGVLFEGPVDMRASALTITDVASGKQLPVVLSTVSDEGHRLAGWIGANGVFDGPLYRVRPAGGFKPGALYHFKGNSPVTRESWVRIDDTTIDTRTLGATLRTLVAPNLEPFDFGGGCRYRGELAVITVIDVDLPPALQAYRASLFASDDRRDGSTWRERELHYVNEWYTVGSMRERQQPGLQTRLYGSAAANVAKGLAGAVQVQMGFLEIDDTITALPRLPQVADLSKIASLDSLAYLRAAQQSKDPSRIAAQLLELPVRSTDTGYFTDEAGPGPLGTLYRQQRFLQLQSAVAHLLADPDPGIRWRAADALTRLVGTTAPTARAINRAAVLMRRSAHDSDPHVQAHAARNLQALLLFAELNDLQCNRPHSKAAFLGCVDTSARVRTRPLADEPGETHHH
ncbi:MAG: HEAT repeat domain-containing protein [Massilia sp.]